MYYRVAIQRQGDQLDRPPSWQWKSTALSSLSTLFQFLRLFGAVRLDHLRVFSSSSREGLQEQLEQENQGRGSPSVTAAHFLQQRRVHAASVTRETPAREGGADQQMGATAVATQPPVNEHGRGGTVLERRREELESGAGGDHDLPYRFSSPNTLLTALVWMKLLVRVHHGELSL